MLERADHILDAIDEGRNVEFGVLLDQIRDAVEVRDILTSEEFGGVVEIKLPRASLIQTSIVQLKWSSFSDGITDLTSFLGGAERIERPLIHPEHGPEHLSVVDVNTVAGWAARASDEYRRSPLTLSYNDAELSGLKKTMEGLEKVSDMIRTFLDSNFELSELIRFADT